MRFKPLKLLVLGALLSAATAALAHHSFAVFFDSEKTVTVSGVVTEFQFRNPHGLIRLTVKNEKGAEEQWKIETNSPSVLRRRGWNSDSLKVGDEVTVEGWPARDGSKYLRMRKVTRPDGTQVGMTFGFYED
ncbi:MAG: DUF6152 family protein [Pseudomonadota bacterium]|jgi:hypothetical protein|nr:MAG: hypothetical protein DIU56_06415 [Pseudomonadota bacterium]